MLKLISAVAGRHKKLFVWLAMFGFMAVFAVGVIRLLDFTLPMWQGRYAVAGTNKTMYKQVEDPDDPHPAFALEPEQSWQDRALIELVYRCPKAVDGVVGRRVVAMYNAGVAAYLQNDYDTARGWFEKAHEACGNENGRVPEDMRETASMCQLMLGMSHENGAKHDTDKAYEAYKQSLVYWGDNTFATYNLERLQDSKKGGGKSPDDKNKQNPQPTAPKKRI